jgi:hypothetical protein
MPPVGGVQRPAVPTGKPADWKDQSTYQGAQSGVGGGRPQTAPPVTSQNLQQNVPPNARPAVPPPAMFGQQPRLPPASGGDWKGQSTYQGAHPGMGGGRPQTAPPVSARDLQQNLPPSLRPTAPAIPPAAPATQGWKPQTAYPNAGNVAPPATSYQRPLPDRPAARPLPFQQPPAATFQRPESPPSRLEQRPAMPSTPEIRPPQVFRPAPPPVAPVPRPEFQPSPPPVMSAPPRPEPRPMPMPQARPEARQMPQSSGYQDPRAFAKPGHGKSREDQN